MSDPAVWIILFRGVGGSTQLPVAPLRRTLADAGFTKVATYINSGNAIVESTLPREALVQRVADICAREFGFHKDVHAVPLVEWEALVEANPVPEADIVPKFLLAAVLARDPEPENVESLRALAAPGETFAVIDGVAYLHAPGGFDGSKLAARFDRGIGVPNTARNWNTVLKLAELGRAAHRLTPGQPRPAGSSYARPAPALDDLADRARHGDEREEEDGSREVVRAARLGGHVAAEDDEEEAGDGTPDPAPAVHPPSDRHEDQHRDPAQHREDLVRAPVHDALRGGHSVDGRCGLRSTTTA